MNVADKIRWLLGKEAGSITAQGEKSMGDSEYTFYRCKKCGYWTKSIGFLHGHMEGHTPWYSIADVTKFMDWTEKLTVEEYRVKDLQEFPEEGCG